jgi:hypothetical protein
VRDGLPESENRRLQCESTAHHAWPAAHGLLSEGEGAVGERHGYAAVGEMRHMTLGRLETELPARRKPCLVA